MQRALGKARPRGAEAAREAILDAAAAIFARDGFSGARVDEIAAAAGYNKALIFHYFDDKLGLYRAQMSRTKERLFAQFEAVFARLVADGAEVPSRGQMEAFATECLRVIFDYYAEHPETTRILAWEAAEGWQTFSSCTPTVPGTWPQRAMALVTRAQAAGIVRADLDPRILFTTIMSVPLIHMVSLRRFALQFPEADFTSSQAIAHARDQITRMLLGGILTPGREA
jgi:AcrR family transcriptional regulator